MPASLANTTDAVRQADAGPETAKHGDEWERFTDPATGRHYVINKRTQASEWTNTWTEKKLDINAATGQQQLASVSGHGAGGNGTQ